MLHWILNPGLAISELLLGQRTPAVYIVDKESEKPLVERTFIPCPHCEELHDSRIWSPQNNLAFKNWYGLYCINCKKVIPCLRNVFSYLILVITYPFWAWFKGTHKERWLAKQPKRYASIDIEKLGNPYQGYSWLKQGLGFGIIMYIFMQVLFPLFTSKELNQDELLLGIPFWLFCGLFFGIFMKFTMMRKGKNAVHS